MYEVQTICDKRFNSNNKAEYLVKWVGHSSNSNSWEPEETLCFVKHHIDAFNKRMESQKNKKKQLGSLSQDEELANKGQIFEQSQDSQEENKSKKRESSDSEQDNNKRVIPPTFSQRNDNNPRRRRNGNRGPQQKQFSQQMPQRQRGERSREKPIHPRQFRSSRLNGMNMIPQVSALNNLKKGPPPPPPKLPINVANHFRDQSQYFPPPANNNILARTPAPAIPYRDQNKKKGQLVKNNQKNNFAYWSNRQQFYPPPIPMNSKPNKVAPPLPPSLSGSFNNLERQRDGQKNIKQYNKYLTNFYETDTTYMPPRPNNPDSNRQTYNYQYESPQQNTFNHYNSQGHHVLQILNMQKKDGTYYYLAKTTEGDLWLQRSHIVPAYSTELCLFYEKNIIFEQ